jgi:hypothetical protein
MARPLRAGGATGVCLLLTLIGLLLPTAQGCHYPPAVHTYDYVTDYERMSDGCDPLLSLVYVPEPVSFKDCREVVIGDIGVGEAWVDSPDEAVGYATLFRVALRNKLARLGRFETVSLDKEDADPANKPPPGTILVEGKLTMFDMGSGFLRYVSYFLWFVQSGATDFQVEGRVRDAATGKLLVEFADRRRYLCNTPFGPNPHNFERGYAMKVTVADAAQCLARFIAAGRYGLPAVSAASPPPQTLLDVAEGIQ